MSRVYILAADKELPPCDKREFREHTGGKFTIGLTCGFKVEPLKYYRQAVEELNYSMRPFRYEFTLEKDERDLENLRAYLEENFSQGEILELWSTWLSGDINKKCPPRFQGRLVDLDMEALEQFLSAEELCFTITI